MCLFDPPDLDRMGFLFTPLDGSGNLVGIGSFGIIFGHNSKNTQFTHHSIEKLKLISNIVLSQFFKI